MQKYLAAIERGDLSGLAELAATSMAGQLALAQGELQTLLAEGLVVQVPVVGRNAEGELEVVAERPVETPRAANTLQLLRQLGHTAADQAITPRSSSERERDQGLGLAGRAAWVNQMRRGLAGEGEDAKVVNPRSWSEFWRAAKPGAEIWIYSVPTGDRLCTFQRIADNAIPAESVVPADTPRLVIEQLSGSGPRSGHRGRSHSPRRLRGFGEFLAATTRHLANSNSRSLLL